MPRARLLVSVALAMASALVIGSGANAVTGPPLSDVSISLDSWATGFTRPIFITSRPGDDRVYVVEQAGQIISLLPDGTGRTTVLDISDIVGSSNGGEQGLLGIAFQPSAPDRLFVDYTDTNGDSRLAEYSFPIAAGTADPDAVQLLLRVAQPYRNHNGGMIAFGPDGYLYIGFGDGGSAGDPKRNGQNPKTKLGTILRIDVDQPTGYGIPPTNPFANGKRGAKEVWAYGLRNPWRFSFDGNRLYIGDVGQYKYEELNIVNATDGGGTNFGWRTIEGNRCFPSGAACSNSARGFVGPKYTYSHSSNGRCAITGGYVYRGEAYPQLQGIYFFGDFCSGEIFGLRMVRSFVAEKRVLINTSALISSFGVGSDGQIYVADLSSGAVRRLIPAP
jgi:glucose/arabinose dehydrogenase